MITGGGGQLASDLELLLADGWETAAPPRAELDVTDDAAVESAVAELPPRGRIQLRRLPQRRRVRTERGPRVRGQRPGGEAARRALRRDRRSARPPEHQLRVRRRAGRPLRRGRPPAPAKRLRDLQAGRRGGGARVLSRCACGAHRRPLRPPGKRVKGRELRHPHGRAGPRAGQHQDGRRPAPDAHVHGRSRRGPPRRRRGRGRRRRAPDQLRRVLLARVHRRRSWSCRGSRRGSSRSPRRGLPEAPIAP